MSETVVLVDDLKCWSGISACRICHELEFEGCKSLESPCACSGTVKFAHRDCIQRWCNEKGNTTCEICLQKFKPGYTCIPKKTQLTDTTVTIRGSLEVPRIEPEQENMGEILETYSECDSAAETSASCCRSVGLIFTALFLIRHLFVTVTGEAEAYPFSLLTVVIVKVSGVLVPMYILMRIVDVIHNKIKHRQYQDSDGDLLSSNDERGERAA
ncbi:Ubiquitin--protein ligase [Handroanthus impetiginosus]|uniref:Ubiquitin--protein ligase n=1 Tax=Handroanthus impetiginosus TaxID=429701 RepID=A0A2G9HE89_9LAMI|nr:Ubiquitin--protein ligase [Handroanthus impetiginosus]